MTPRDLKKKFHDQVDAMTAENMGIDINVERDAADPNRVNVNVLARKIGDLPADEN